MGLLAYPDPSSSTLSYLLQIEQREKVADNINSSILEFISNITNNATTNSSSILEKLLKQLMLSSKTLKEENGGYGYDINNNNLMYKD